MRLTNETLKRIILKHQGLINSDKHQNKNKKISRNNISTFYKHYKNRGWRDIVYASKSRQTDLFKNEILQELLLMKLENGDIPQSKKLEVILVAGDKL